MPKNNGKNGNRDNINTWISWFYSVNYWEGLNKMKLGYRLYIYIWAIIFSFHWPTHVSLMCNESYKQSSEKTKNNGEHEKSDNTKTWVSWVYSLMLETYIHRL